MELTREEAEAMFGENRLKLALIEKIPSGERITAYRCGEFVDLCQGNDGSYIRLDTESQNDAIHNQV